LGPVIVVDDEYHGNMSPAKVKKLLKTFYCLEGDKKNGKHQTFTTTEKLQTIIT